MPLPIEGQQDWADDLNEYLLGAAVEVQATLEGAVTSASAAILALDQAADAANTSVSTTTALSLAEIASAQLEAAFEGAALIQGILALQGGTNGLFLDVDGQPFFDSTYTPGPGEPVLALLTDADGVPYYTGA